MVSWCKLHENDDILLATMSVFSTTGNCQNYHTQTFNWPLLFQSFQNCCNLNWLWLNVFTYLQRHYLEFLYNLKLSKFDFLLNVLHKCSLRQTHCCDMNVEKHTFNWIKTLYFYIIIPNCYYINCSVCTFTHHCMRSGIQSDSIYFFCLMLYIHSITVL